MSSSKTIVNATQETVQETALESTPTTTPNELNSGKWFTAATAAKSKGKPKDKAKVTAKDTVQKIYPISLNRTAKGNVSLADFIKYLFAVVMATKNPELISLVKTFDMKNRSQAVKKQRTLVLLVSIVLKAFLSFKKNALEEGVVINYNTYQKVFAVVNDKKIFLWELFYALERWMEKPLDEVVFQFSETETTVENIHMNVSFEKGNYTVFFIKNPVKKLTLEEKFPPLQKQKKQHLSKKDRKGIEAEAAQLKELTDEDLDALLEEEKQKSIARKKEEAEQKAAQKVAKEAEWEKKRLQMVEEKAKKEAELKIREKERKAKQLALLRKANADAERKAAEQQMEQDKGSDVIEGITTSVASTSTSQVHQSWAEVDDAPLSEKI